MRDDPVFYVITVAAGFLYLDRASKQRPPPPPPGDAKAYVRNLKLSGVEMSAHEDYFKQRIVEMRQFTKMRPSHFPGSLQTGWKLDLHDIKLSDPAEAIDRAARPKMARIKPSGFFL